MADRIVLNLCPNTSMSALIASVGNDEAVGLRELDALLADYPRDPRLHFLKGSLLAAKEEYPAARAAMRHAVDLAPDYAIARFQLGFLLLTSGEAKAAEQVWVPLLSLAPENSLRVFATGLGHMIRDEFDDAIRILEDGIARNNENPAMNRDMQLLITEMRNRQGTGEPPTSSVDLLLRQSAMKSTKH